jgi:ubiquinone/menaquinone biosynthesis C-methylase UbiE
MISDHYRINTPFIFRDFNKLFPVPYYINEMLIKRGDYKIADLGAGPVCKLGGKMAGASIEIYASDVAAKEYKEVTDELVKRTGQELLIPIEYQDMENLTYPDEMFDIVHCVNTLDHTRNARKAIEEMKRVCKKGGWIYLRHAPYQKRYLRGDHFWDATMEGFDNGKELFTLDGFKTGTDGFMIISVMKKE